MHGVLVVDKPAGPTSHDVVARVRATLGIPRAGHTGTLDPLATGVLPLVLGRATRLAQFLSASSKTYEATVRLGIVTDTFDTSGRVVSEQPVPAGSLTPERIEQALAAFRGSYLQQPPPFSAKKVGGERAYALARRSVAAVLPPVPVTVEALDLAGIDATSIRLRVTASAGFYVRVLAHQLGAALGPGGCLEALRRTRSGEFSEADAVTLEMLERDAGSARRHLQPLDALLRGLPTVYLTDEGGRRAAHGAAIRPFDTKEGSESAFGSVDRPVRLIDAQGHLVGLARGSEDGSALHPIVVLG
jgi:tRNA pseudouridine55 synthase